MLTIRASDPNKYALVLLEALFTDEELGRSCYAKTSRSTKPPLPAEKIALLEGKYRKLCTRAMLLCNMLLCYRMHQTQIWQGGNERVCQ